MEGRREWLLIGEPLRTLLVPLKLAKAAFCRAPAIGGHGLLADCGRRSWGGESSKHSLSDMDDDGDDGLSPPNRKGGSWLSPTFQRLLGLIRPPVE